MATLSTETFESLLPSLIKITERIEDGDMPRQQHKKSVAQAVRVFLYMSCLHFQLEIMT